MIDWLRFVHRGEACDQVLSFVGCRRLTFCSSFAPLFLLYRSWGFSTNDRASSPVSYWHLLRSHFLLPSTARGHSLGLGKRFPYLTACPITISFDLAARCFSFLLFVVSLSRCVPNPLLFLSRDRHFYTRLVLFPSFLFRTSEWTIVHFFHNLHPAVSLVNFPETYSRKFWGICVVLLDWLIHSIEEFPSSSF